MAVDFLTAFLLRMQLCVLKMGFEYNNRCTELFPRTQLTAESQGYLEYSGLRALGLSLLFVITSDLFLKLFKMLL